MAGNRRHKKNCLTPDMLTAGTRSTISIFLKHCRPHQKMTYHRLVNRCRTLYLKNLIVYGRSHKEFLTSGQSTTEAGLVMDGWENNNWFSVLHEKNEYILKIGEKIQKP